MKRILLLALAFVCISGLCGCNSTAVGSDAGIGSKDYSRVIDLARAEFAEVFKDIENVQIEETKTMARSDDTEEIVVQFQYSSSCGDGVYGFLYSLDDQANPELIQHGEDITMDSLLR